ncbi:hypothetical protein F4859DRAFT_96849 [Xylaria cf. heliscus]|nr:hypothetical protein F4859DRAFT_96849 [Xylaria cf. heliscus]
MDLTTLLNTSADEAINGRTGRETTNGLNQGSTTPDDGVGESSSPIRDSPSGKSISRGVGDVKFPSRSRTPWDANGYTMPLINLAVESSPAIPLLELQIDAASPQLPKHKISDSYSSFSSLTSPSTSTLSHSRFSSMSTAGDAQPIDTISDFPSVEVGSGCPVFDGQGSQRLRRDGFPPVAIKEETFTHGPSRHECSSGTPSIPSSLQHISPTRTFATSSNNEAEPEFRHLVPLDFNNISMHKRNLSAPDPTRFNSLNRTLNRPNDISELVPTSHFNQQKSGRIMANANLWESSVITTSPQEDHPVKCEFMENCNTGSTLRKTVSHVFGRNKLCTRMIPDHVWVHFCRKHYQRKRYRSIQDYALLQCRLVRVQICRVHDWSESRKVEEGKPGILQSWTLTLRKREQERRQHRDLSEEKEDDESADFPIPGGPNGTSVPSWLASLCREGYDTAEMIKIVDRIKNELDEKKKMHFPDIEILPNLIVDGVLEVGSGTQNKTHKRSQSLNFATYNKRQRNLGVVPSRNSARLKPTESLSRPMDTLAFPRRPRHYPQVGGSNPNSDTIRGTQYSYGGGPLPVPRPPRESDYLTTDRELSVPGHGGATHHRSVSDLTGNCPPSNMEFTFRMNGPAAHSSFTPVSNYNYYPVLHEYVPLPPEPKPTTYWAPPSNYSYYPAFPQSVPLPAEPKPSYTYSGLSSGNGRQLNVTQRPTPPTESHWPSSNDYSRSAEGSELGHLRHQSTPS